MLKHLQLILATLFCTYLFLVHSPYVTSAQVCYGSHTYVDYGCDYNSITRQYTCETLGSDVQSCGSSCTTFGMVFCQGGTSCTRSSYPTNCSVYYPPPPPPPESEAGGGYTCMGTACVWQESGGGYADYPSCALACGGTPPPEEPPPSRPIVCGDRLAPDKNTYVLSDGFLDPGQTISWTTHQNGGGTQSTIATRISSTAAEADTYAPPNWSSFTCPGDSICLVTKFQNAAMFVEAHEVILESNDKYCRQDNGVFTNTKCSDDDDCSGSDNCRYQPLKHFFYGPNNSTYIMTPEERQASLDSTWPSELWSDTDISTLSPPKIPFSSYIFVWVNCASLIKPDLGQCPPRQAGNPATGNYFAMERDIYRVNEPGSEFWCTWGDRYECRKHDDGILRFEWDNPLAYGNWYRESIIQIPLEYLQPGANRLVFKVAANARATYDEKMDCTVSTYNYNYDPSELEFEIAQASCNAIQFESGLEAEDWVISTDRTDQIARLGIGDTVEMSGTFSPATEIFPVPNGAFTGEAGQFPLDWSGYGTPNAISALIQNCPDTEICWPFGGQTYLALNPTPNSTNQYVASSYFDTYRQPDGTRYGFSLSVRPNFAFDPTMPPTLTGVNLQRYPNFYREPQNHYSEPISGKYIKNEQAATTNYFYLGGSTTQGISMRSGWQTIQGFFEFPERADADLVHPNTWRRDMALSSTKMRMVLPLIAGSPTDYKNVVLTSDPTPETLSFAIAKINNITSMEEAKNLRAADGTWQIEPQQFNWTAISPTWQYNTAGYRKGTWQINSNLEPGFYLLAANIGNGFRNGDYKDKAVCTGNPYPVDPGAWADCSDTCAKIIELVQCVDSVASISSIEGDSGPLSSTSTTSIEVLPNISSESGQNDYYNIRVIISKSDPNYDPNQSVELLLYHDDSYTPPAESLEDAILPAGAERITNFTVEDLGSSTMYVFKINPTALVGNTPRLHARAYHNSCDFIASPWISRSIRLQGNISGFVREVSSQIAACDVTQPLLTDNQSYLTQYSQTVNGATENKSATFGSTNFSLSSTSTARPIYEPQSTGWTNGVTSFSLPATIAINNSEDSYICVSGTVNGTRCAYDVTSNFITPARYNASRPTINMCYIKGNVMHNSWWQARGGLIFAENAVKSNLPLKINKDPSDDCQGEACQPYVAAKAMGITGDYDPSAGFVVTNSSVTDEPSGAIGYLSQNTIQSGAAAMITSGSEKPISNALTLPNYDSFLSKVDESRVTSVSNSHSGVEAFVEGTGNIYESKDGVNTKIGRITRITDDTTISFAPPTLSNNTRIQVPDNTRVILFVEGNLRLDFPVGNVVQNLISVGNNSTLIIISSGSITFANSLGYNNTTDLTKVDPIVSGIFFADGEIIVESNGGATPDDKKFVGAGSFIGMSGVQLNRKFDSTDVLSREKNAQSPTEMFIHRPDLVVNAPEILMETEIKWQEVN